MTRRAYPVKYSHPAKMALSRVRPASPAALGSSYEEDILDALESTFQDPQKQSGLTKKEFLEVIWKAARYYQKGYSRDKAKAKALRDQIAKEMKISDAARKSGILRALLFLEAITADKYPVLAAYLTKGQVTISDRAAAVKTTAKEAGSAAVDHLKTVARETISDTGRLITGAVDSANSVLPWYLKPKILLPVGLAAVALFYGGPLLRMIPKPRNYQKNPVEPRKVARNGRKRAAAATFEDFHDREPDAVYSIPAIDTRELVELGGALCVGYESDKWTGKPADYLHDFESAGVRLYATADRKALVIAGGALNVTKRGITG